MRVDPLADDAMQIDKSPYQYVWNNPILLTDPDGRCPKCWVSAFRVGKKAYKIYKKTGKLTPKSLKKAGLDEVVDIAGDLQTIFSGDAGWLDRAGAAADLIVGTDFNSKGNKAVSKSLGLADDANDVRKAGKAKNKLEPDGDATGDHTVFKRDDNGDVYKYETYEKTRTGHDNPTKRFDGGKPDGSPGAPHTNKQTKEKVPTPHVQGKKIPGGVRPARPDEIPNNKRFNNGG